jgi:hypothetical protein
MLVLTVCDEKFIPLFFQNMDEVLATFLIVCGVVLVIALLFIISIGYIEGFDNDKLEIVYYSLVFYIVLIFAYMFIGIIREVVKVVGYA